MLPPLDGAAGSGRRRGRLLRFAGSGRGLDLGEAERTAAAGGAASAVWGCSFEPRRPIMRETFASRLPFGGGLGRCRFGRRNALLGLRGRSAATASEKARKPLAEAGFFRRPGADLGLRRRSRQRDIDRDRRRRQFGFRLHGGAIGDHRAWIVLVDHELDVAALVDDCCGRSLATKVGCMPPSRPLLIGAVGTPRAASRRTAVRRAPLVIHR